MNDQQSTNTEVSRRLRDLIEFPRESLEIELKEWLNLRDNPDKANLAQAILALANYGGGYILIGFEESNNQWKPAGSRPENFDFYSQDIINGIVQRFAEPPFHCDVYLVNRPSDGLDYPVIIIPGDHTVPIRAARSGPGEKHVQQYQYYTRAPGPCSRQINSAREWDEIIGRCIRAKREELVDNFRELLFGHPTFTRFQEKEQLLESPKETFEKWISQSEERREKLIEERLKGETPSRFVYGVWWVAYLINHEFKQPPLSEFLETLRAVKGRETGWPPWWVPTRPGIEAFPYNENIECCLFEKLSPHLNDRLADAAHSDFWRASPQGRMYIARGYDEDGSDAKLRGIEPGTIFDVTLPIWRIGECLLHAERLGRKLAGENASIVFKVNWSGLTNRKLTTWANPSRLLFDERVCRQNTVDVETTFECNSVGTNLPEIVQALTGPLYEAFEFFKPSPEVYHQELSKMRGRSMG